MSDNLKKTARMLADSLRTARQANEPSADPEDRDDPNVVWAESADAALKAYDDMPKCVVCGDPFDHGCNTAACSLECEAAGYGTFEVETPDGMQVLSTEQEIQDWIAVLSDDDGFEASLLALPVGGSISGQAFDYDVGNYDYTITRRA